MPRLSRLQPVPISRDEESLGQRLARLGKERGFTQKELAAKTGLIQALISDYERDKLRLNAEMISALRDCFGNHNRRSAPTPRTQAGSQTEPKGPAPPGVYRIDALSSADGSIEDD